MSNQYAIELAKQQAFDLMTTLGCVIIPGKMEWIGGIIEELNKLKTVLDNAE